MKGRTIVTRSVRRTRRGSRLPSPALQRETAAVQIFLFRDERFLGSQLFDVRQPVIIGRSRRASLRLEGDTLSRLHCRFLYEQGEILIEDLGSANGTFVNRARVAGRLLVEPTDAINLGTYSLRARAIHAVESMSASELADTEAITRVEAVLSAGSESESEEAVLDLSVGVDRRLYEDAIARVTGEKRPLRLASVRGPAPESGTSPTDRTGGSEAFWAPSDPDGDLEDAHVDPSPSEQLHGGLSPQRPISDDIPLRLGFKAPSEAVRLDPDVEARLRDLDELIAALDAKQRSMRESSRRGFAQRGASLYAIDGLAERPVPQGELASSSSGRLEREVLEGLKAMSADDLSRDLGSKAAFRAPATGAKPAPGGPPPLPSTAIPSAPIPKGPPPLPRLSTVPHAPMSEAHEPASDTADTAKGSASTEEESGPFEDVWTKSSRVSPAYVPPAQKQAPPAPPAQKQKTLPDRIPKTLKDPPPPGPVLPPPPLPRKPRTADRSSGPTERQKTGAAYFDAVEIAARERGRLVDVSLLQKEGDQYVLGHSTPQGRVAPGSSHAGLRMLRINPDRTVDLVFPRDVGGHLVRGRETVMFSELTEGRKYSCLRLEAKDIATIILGDGGRAISYHVRFLTKGSKPSRPALRAT